MPTSPDDLLRSRGGQASQRRTSAPNAPTRITPQGAWLLEDDHALAVLQTDQNCELIEHHMPAGGTQRFWAT